jgi:hypothetical protein
MSTDFVTNQTTGLTISTGKRGRSAPYWYERLKVYTEESVKNFQQGEHEIALFHIRQAEGAIAHIENLLLGMVEDD